MRSKALFAISLALLMAVVAAVPVAKNRGGGDAYVAKTGADYWGEAETFWNVSTGTCAPASFNDMVLFQQTYTDSVVLNGWLWEMTKANMAGAVARFAPSGPSVRTNDWNISAEITRPRDDSSYTPHNLSVAAGNQSLMIYLTNDTGFVVAGLNLTTGSVYGESIWAYDAFNALWTKVADDIYPALPNDHEDYGYLPDHYVVSFSHRYLASTVEIIVRNTATGMVFRGSYSIPTLEGVDNPQLRFEIRSNTGTYSVYNVAGGWIIDNLMFRSMSSRYPTIGPVYELVTKQDPLWLDVRDGDGIPVTDAEVSIGGVTAAYNGSVARYEAHLALPVDWDVPIPYTVLVDGVLMNDTLKVSTTPNLDSRVSLPRWWNGWDWVTVLGRDDSANPLSAPMTFAGFDHPKTSYINQGFIGNSTELLPTQSEIALHYPHNVADWGTNFWTKAVTDSQDGHAALENSYWFASRWDDPRYVGVGDMYISFANPGNSGSWEQMFAEYARGTRLMGLSSQFWLAGNSSLIGSYWLYGPNSNQIPGWASWHPYSRMDMMDMFRGLSTDSSNYAGMLMEWGTARAIAQAGGVFRIYNHGSIIDPDFIQWLCDDKTNFSFENWKAADGEVASYVYGSRSTDVVYNSSSTHSTWIYDVSRRSPYSAGYWKVPVTIAVDITDMRVLDVEINSGPWDLKMSDGSLRNLQGNRTMDVGYDIRGDTLYVSYFWNSSSKLTLQLSSLSNPRAISVPVTSALAWGNYTCVIESTPPDNGTTSWTLEVAPAWLTIDSFNDTLCTLKGVPEVKGTYEVLLRVSDNNSTTWLNWTIDVVKLKFIDGFVRDSGALPLPNVTVMVTFRSGPTIVSVKYADTDSLGRYSVTFMDSDWNAGNGIEVSSVHNSSTALNTTIADEYPYQEIDLRFTAEVPEFGAPLGTVFVVGSFALLACFLIYRRRR